MQISKDILSALEENTEEGKLYKLKNNLQLQSDRTARVVLHILENDPEKYQQKVQKEIIKLENKIEKEYKKMHKKIDSFIQNHNYNKEQKISVLKQELAELKKLT